VSLGQKILKRSEAWQHLTVSAFKMKEADGIDGKSI
jgi:hypothetical protein